MQQCLGGWSTGICFHRTRVVVDTQNLGYVQPAFIDRALGDGDHQRIVLENDAEIAARSKNPASPVKIVADLDKPVRSLSKVHDFGIILAAADSVGAVCDRAGGSMNKKQSRRTFIKGAGVAAGGLLTPAIAQAQQASSATKGDQFRNLLQGAEPVLAPGVHDVLTARLVEQMGFPAMTVEAAPFLLST